jgi:hypothetical protein
MRDALPSDYGASICPGAKEFLRALEVSMAVPSRPISEIARSLSPSEVVDLFREAHFPADRAQLVNYARDHFASADLLAVLDSIPAEIYHSPAQVLNAISALAG